MAGGVERRGDAAAGEVAVDRRLPALERQRLLESPQVSVEVALRF